MFACDLAPLVDASIDAVLAQLARLKASGRVYVAQRVARPGVKSRPVCAYAATVPEAQTWPDISAMSRVPSWPATAAGSMTANSPQT